MSSNISNFSSYINFALHGDVHLEEMPRNMLSQSYSTTRFMSFNQECARNNPCSELSVFTLNANRLLRKYALFQKIFDSKIFNVLCISETHYRINSDALQADNFSCVSSFGEKSHMGVSIWCANYLLPLIYYKKNNMQFYLLEIIMHQ